MKFPERKASKIMLFATFAVVAVNLTLAVQLPFASNGVVRSITDMGSSPNWAEGMFDSYGWWIADTYPGSTLLTVGGSSGQAGILPEVFPALETSVRVDRTVEPSTLHLSGQTIALLEPLRRTVDTALINCRNREGIRMRCSFGVFSKNPEPGLEITFQAFWTDNYEISLIDSRLIKEVNGE